jgi:hypothetical protein
VGNTVDVEMATDTNSIGDALMMAYWKDPAFDPAKRAFHYVRVLKIPTPRWTTYDAVLRHRSTRGGATHTPGARLYLADLVFAVGEWLVTYLGCEPHFPNRGCQAP